MLHVKYDYYRIYQTRLRGTHHAQFYRPFYLRTHEEMKPGQLHSYLLFSRPEQNPAVLDNLPAQADRSV